MTSAVGYRSGSYVWLRVGRTLTSRKTGPTTYDQADIPRIPRAMTRSLVSAVAYAKWADAGPFRVATITDPEIAAASSAFARAAQLLPEWR